jgi:hypothetical protein
MVGMVHGFEIIAKSSQNLGNNSLTLKEEELQTLSTILSKSSLNPINSNLTLREARAMKTNNYTSSYTHACMW